MTREEAARLLHAYVDGELDAVKSVELEAHLAADPVSRTACEQLRGMSGSIREQADYHAAPPSLAASLRNALPDAPEAKPGRSMWRSWPGMGVALAAMALLTWTATVGYLRPGEEERLVQDVLASHVRATLAQRRFDVASSDQHTVKPWLSSRLPYSPPVTDFSAHGFDLRGARLDFLDGKPVAVLAYQRRLHWIDVYVRPGRESAATLSLTRDGFNIQGFSANGMNYWLVSDLNKNELADLARLLEQKT